MRVIIALALVTAVMALGGCFHHQQVYTEQVLAPTPIK
jgi:hypothetical protein